MNDNFIKRYTRAEFNEALKQMGPLESHGLDGFGACFYQNHWSISGEKVSVSVLKILNGEGMTSTLNSTFIALIPKKSNPEFAHDFKSISLCNVLYKLVSKVISNKLKPLMSSIISSNQSAFILS